MRGSPTSGVSITSVVWGDGTPCALSNQIYSCAIGTVGSSTAFDIKITYAVSQSAVTSTSVQQTTIAVRSNQPDLGSGAGESIHRVWGKEGNTQTNVVGYGAFWGGEMHLAFVVVLRHVVPLPSRIQACWVFGQQLKKIHKASMSVQAQIWRMEIHIIMSLQILGQTQRLRHKLII